MNEPCVVKEKEKRCDEDEKERKGKWVLSESEERNEENAKHSQSIPIPPQVPFSQKLKKIQT